MAKCCLYIEEKFYGIGKTGYTFGKTLNESIVFNIHRKKLNTNLRATCKKVHKCKKKYEIIHLST